VSRRSSPKANKSFKTEAKIERIERRRTTKPLLMFWKFSREFAIFCVFLLLWEK
jgi:hypothetical protein